MDFVPMVLALMDCSQFDLKQMFRELKSLLDRCGEKLFLGECPSESVQKSALRGSQFLPIA